MRNLNLSVTGFLKALRAIESNKDSVRNAMILGYRSDSKRQKQGQEPCRNRKKRHLDEVYCCRLPTTRQYL